VISTHPGTSPRSEDDGFSGVFMTCPSHV
jgi:hypothetical protein